MKTTDFTGLIIPTVSMILASLTFSGIMWSGYILGVLGLFAISISAAVPMMMTSADQLNFAFGIVELAINGY